MNLGGSVRRPVGDRGRGYTSHAERGIEEGHPVDADTQPFGRDEREEHDLESVKERVRHPGADQHHHVRARDERLHSFA